MSRDKAYVHQETHFRWHKIDRVGHFCPSSPVFLALLPSKGATGSIAASPRPLPPTLPLPLRLPVSLPLLLPLPRPLSLPLPVHSLHPTNQPRQSIIPQQRSPTHDEHKPTLEVMNVEAEPRDGLEEYPCPPHDGHDDFEEKVPSDKEGDEEPAFAV